MRDENNQYSTPNEWRDAAMLRPSLSDEEIGKKRRAFASIRGSSKLEGFNPDTEDLLDDELHLQGKMDANEYVEYLIFKAKFNVASKGVANV